MPGLSRVGDKNNAGGRLLRGAKTVMCDGRPVALHVSPLTPHDPKTGLHVASVTVTGSPTVFCEGSPVVRIGSATNCGHVIVGGSGATFVP